MSENNNYFVITDTQFADTQEHNIQYKNTEDAEIQKDLSTLKLIKIFSILSICISITVVFSFVAAAFGIVATILSSKRIKQYKEAPVKYTETSFKKIKKFRIIAIVGIILSVGVFFGVQFYSNYHQLDKWNNINVYEQIDNNRY